MNDRKRRNRRMHNFRPLSCLLPNGPKIALIVLNQPIHVPTLSALWKKSVFTAAADGATNHLHKLAVEFQSEYVPDLISGDFDSAQPKALEYYRQKDKVEIVSTPDEDETDFTKCLRLVTQKLKSFQEVDHIVALGAFGGRHDHCMANINTLFIAQSLTSKPVLLIGEGNAACLLDKGSHTLKMDTGLEDAWCGLVPIGMPASSVTTTGLKYNLNEDGMQFGGLISTSNSLSDSTVTISTDQPLLWMQGYKQETF